MIRRMLDDFKEYTKDPTSFLKAQPEIEEKIKCTLKSAYDITKKLEDYRHQNTLSKLIIRNFDTEQIYQQIQIQNEFAHEELLKRLSTYVHETNRVIESDAVNEKEITGPSSEERPETEDEDSRVEEEENDEKVVEEKRVRFNLDENIQKLEKEALQDKPWQLRGEISAKIRPENSLLEEYLEFDVTTRPVPVITEEAALKLEDVILRRIKDKAWDDVERKIKPVENPYEFKKKLILNQEKSKISLAQIYEQEYLKQKEAADPLNKFKDEEEPKEHKQIRGLLDSLFRKLDSLSNYHYTPMPAAPELQIVNNLPAVTLEEAIPDTVSNAVLLAPQEIQAKVRGDLKSAPERTTTDKKRSRRKKKLKQKLRKKAIGNDKQPKKKLKKNKKINRTQ